MPPGPDPRVRIGIDVGGTFTKAVALDARTGEILSQSTVPTTHAAGTGVSEGVISALDEVMDMSGIRASGIELISHSTTQAINALLESDTSAVGIIAMGVGPEKKDIIKRTSLQGTGINAAGIHSVHEFLDTSHLITEEEAGDAVKRLRGAGAQVIVATEAYGVDDPSNEEFVMKIAQKNDMPSTASHEISGIYGLEIRTLTAAVNASVLPRTYQVADFVESAIRRAGVTAPLMIMKGDGGVTSMDTFRSKPILTILSGPAASVAGALLHLRVTNAIFVEVGGTSTNICIIRNGRPEIRYVTIRDHPTCIRSMDVRIVGVAGGSMVRIKNGRVFEVGPRSAHIAGLKYACFAAPDELAGGKIAYRTPMPGDEEYAVIDCGGQSFAITNTCAANALGLVEPGDYSYANQQSARTALEILGLHLGMTYHEVATSIIQTASFQITKTVTHILKEFKIDTRSALVIGGGGGASVLVPFTAKQLGIKYQKAQHAEVISSIGVASSMLHEEMEVSMADPDPSRISESVKQAHQALADKGAIPESIMVDTQYIPDKALLRVTAVGNVAMDSTDTSRIVYDADEARRRASEIMGVVHDDADLIFETRHYMMFACMVRIRRLLKTRERRPLTILDRFGKMRISLRDAMVFDGPAESMLSDLRDMLKSKQHVVVPQVYLLTDTKLMDFSGLVSASHVLGAITDEMNSRANENGRSAIVVALEA